MSDIQDVLKVVQRLEVLRSEEEKPTQPLAERVRAVYKEQGMKLDEKMLQKALQLVAAEEKLASKISLEKEAAPATEVTNALIDHSYSGVFMMAAMGVVMLAVGANPGFITDIFGTTTPVNPPTEGVVMALHKATADMQATMQVMLRVVGFIGGPVMLVNAYSRLVMVESTARSDKGTTNEEQ